MNIKEDESNTESIELDIFLELITNILYKDQEKCICSNNIPVIDNKNTFHETEIIPDLKVAITEDNKIKFSDVIFKLKQQGYPLTGSMISLYLPEMEDYVLVGNDPVDSGIFLDENIIKSKIVKIQAICFIEDQYIPQFLSKGSDKNNNVSNLERKLSKQNSEGNKNKSKRTKERKIGFVIEKVNTWRKYYNGFQDEQGKYTKYSLDEAARKIGISKKSLDDYLLQLRLGRRFGFDFNSNKNTKVGVLRTFVKEHKNAKTI